MKEVDVLDLKKEISKNLKAYMKYQKNPDLHSVGS